MSEVVTYLLCIACGYTVHTKRWGWAATFALLVLR